MLSYFTSTNDINGNPRRGFAWLEDGQPVAFWPEGHSSYLAVPEPFQYRARRAMQCGITITAKFYGKMLSLPSPSEIEASGEFS